jgi:hypothetical protein
MSKRQLVFVVFCRIIKLIKFFRHNCFDYNNIKLVIHLFTIDRKACHINFLSVSNYKKFTNIIIDDRLNRWYDITRYRKMSNIDEH